ncbi:MAG: class I SAM-dependent rRNA methyltransferase [Firmicutes bacterium]|nr:class I SAM-dependent rRNA methyltransferase [Bacillota bacterium]
MERPYPKLTITEKGERALRAGHPWVYGAEVTAVAGQPENGGIVDVYSQKERWLGAGFYNDRSKIRVRILSGNTNDRFDRSYWQRKLRWAVEYRRTVMGADFSACRLIFGEADGFPGLTVDRFGPVLVAQVLCLGTDRIKADLFADLVQLLRGMGEHIDVLYERSDSALRAKEGLPEVTGFFLGSGDGHTEITENGVIYDVDYMRGQKTGFFLDQKYNRAAVARLAAGRTVLDCFTHTGAFGLNCARAGAKHVTSVDVSHAALEQAQANARRNALTQIDFVCADVFELLTQAVRAGKSDYDLIILDPPAFTKSGATVKNAAAGYKDLNLRAMRLLPRGGYLATCSCSHFMTTPLFRRMLEDAAHDAHVQLRQVEQRQQSPDHPILWNVPETDYLKFFIFQVV